MAESLTSNQTRIEQLCAAQGLRMTGQRRVIARVLSTAKDHPDVEEVYQRAHEVDRRISLSTVYRTLKLFAEKGYEADAFDYYTEAAEKGRGFLERNRFLYECLPQKGT